MENDNTQDKRDKLRTLLLDLDPEQIAEYYRFGVALEKFTYEMRCRFVKKQKEGAKGWEEGWEGSNPEALGDGIDKSIHKLEGIGDIDLATWAFIYWHKKNKGNIAMKQYVVYSSPSDYPGKIVVRERLIVRGVIEPVPGQLLCVKENYHDAVSHIPLGTVRIPHQEGDDECLLETWI